MCYLGGMNIVGLRELRQQASELLRKVEAGEEVTITVAGRPSARLVPVAPKQWRSFGEVTGVFGGAHDPDWEQDRARIDQRISERWEE